ncbi:MAG TPA: RecQ family ATP-dependent DNA helicase, partial [Spirochaetota bacterium]|nr:RecQ family ATP-dependent DNA helicase [Spirochaetota bacterium]
LNSTVSSQKQREIADSVEMENLKLLYLTPERFKNENFLKWISKQKISLFAIDEAHCISEWGHDFRVEYRKLKDIIEKIGRPPVLALTATATEEVRADIVKTLDLRDPNIFVSGFNRDNLIYGAQNHLTEEEKNKAVIEFINKISGSGIVYTSSIKSAENLYFILSSNLKKKVGVYHGSLDPSKRKKAQEDFLNNKLEILIATNAFGMGVNKPDIRFVVHYSIPGTIEAYYQETGRAGRDGKLSYCLLMEYQDDIDIQEFFIEAKNPTVEDMEAVLENIKKHSTKKYLYTDDYDLLSDGKNLNNFKLDAVIKQLNFMGFIEFDYVSEEKMEIKFDIKKIVLGKDSFIDELLELRESNSSNLIVNLKYLSRRFDLSDKMIKDKLISLKKEKLINFIELKSGKMIRQLKTSFTKTEKSQYCEKVAKKIARDKEKLKSVIKYASLYNECRRKYLLNYFGEDFQEVNCGKCDICRGTYKNSEEFDFNELQKQIVFFIMKNEDRVGKNKAVKILKGSYDLEPKYRDWDEFGELKSINIVEIENEFNILIGRKIIQTKKGKYPTLKLSNYGLNEVKKRGLLSKKTYA